MVEGLFASIPGLIECRQQTLGDPEICIAIVDSRADLSHPSLAGAALREIMPAWLRSVMGPSGAAHGTHVTSLIFGQPGSPVEGIAPLCRGIIIPVYGETESGELRPCSQEDLGRAISLALEAGAHLINISGGELIRPGDVDPLLSKIVESCNRQDVAITAATGNEGCECLHVPASLPAVLAVGASDRRGQPMPFSNWDESLASHGVLAPGEGIQGAAPGGGVAAHNGTSFACPIVTAAAALLVCLQKRDGLNPSPTAVRDAIIASAIPCTSEDQAQCERLLGGRLNVAGAYEALFEGTVRPSGQGLRAGTPIHAIRAPPVAAATATRLQRDRQNCLETGKSEGTAMTSGHFHDQPQERVGANQGVAPPPFEAIQHPSEHAQAAMPGAWAQPGGALPGMAPTAAATPPTATPPMATAAQPTVYAMPPTAAAVQPAAVHPQCSCGGAQPAQGISYPQHEMMAAQHDAGPAQQPGATAYHGRIPGQSPYGTQPALSPAQRTALIAGYPGSGSQQIAMPAVRGVAPSESAPICPCPLPNDFINTANSQLVYAIGELGYDFITDARRDYFVQQMRKMSEDWHLLGDEAFRSRYPFEADLNLEVGPTYLPEENRAMAAYLFQGRQHLPPPERDQPILAGWPPGEGPTDIGSVVWTLIQEGQALYALRPLHTFANYVLIDFANFLYDQSRPENLIVNPEEKDPAKRTTNPNPNRSERVSIAGRITGDMTLYNGQQVPVLDVSLRALFNWNIKVLIDSVLGDRPQDTAAAATWDQGYARLENFLQRIYYECRNLGQAPSDRAINYLATNLFQANEAFKSAGVEKLELDSIFAEKSPLCRPKSDCWDVIMRFFDPKDRLGKALVEHRLTVDVSDLSPVGIGKTRTWARYA
jgi:hypothetical protein